MRKETLEKKLNKLKEKLKAYEDISRYLSGLTADKEKSAAYREAAYGVLKSVKNMALMVQIGVAGVRHDLKEAG